MKKTVLIVDDSEFSQLKLKKIFTDAGYEVLKPASSVTESVKAVEKNLPDIITMDIVMNDKDGIVGVEEIMSRHPNAKILMISALGQEGLIEDALTKGALGFIVKPYDDETVIKEARRILESQKKARRK